MHRSLDIMSNILIFQLNALDRLYSEVPAHVDGKTEAQRKLAWKRNGIRGIDAR